MVRRFLALFVAFACLLAASAASAEIRVRILPGSYQLSWLGAVPADWHRPGVGITYVQGPVAATGTSPPAVTFSGSPLSATQTIVLTCTGSGTNTTATFSWTINGVSQTGFTAAATVALPGTGQTATFPVGSYVSTPSADTYTSVVVLSGWKDTATGFATNLTQATASQQPAYTASDATFAGYPSITCPGTAANVVLSGSWGAGAMAQPFTWLVVGYSGASGTQAFTTTIGGNVQMDGVSGKGGIYAGTALTSTTSVTSAMVMIGVYHGTSSAVYVNNGNTAAATGTASTNTASTTLVLCSSLVAGTANRLSGKIVEVYASQGLPRAEQIDQAMVFEGKKYGIATQ